MQHICLTIIAVMAGFFMSGSVFARAVPNLNVILNDDGDYSFLSLDPQTSVLDLQARIDALAGTPVKTLAYSVGAGSDVLYYPTKVASVWGWRSTSDGKKKEWAGRIAKIKAGMQAGIDPIRVAGERAKKMGLYFFPSYRMNDDHFMFDPFNYPLTGEFWIKHHKEFIIGDSPIVSSKYYGNLLDFSYPEVRQYRLEVIQEVIGRYQDIMDGIELDFNRVQVFFPKGKAGERGHFITDMVRQVRKWLDEAGARNHREYHLIARVPPTLTNCHWAGLEVEQWMKDGLVDVVCPSQLMTLAHDMPVDEFVKIAKPSGCKVYPSLYPQTSYGWPVVCSPSAQAYASPAQREVTAALVRGAADNYWFLGADGFELFNFHHEDHGRCPYSDRVYRIMRDLAGPRALTLTNDVFAVTPGYYLDYEDTYQNRKQLPVTLQADRAETLTMLIGEDLTAPLMRANGACVVLRLGFKALPDQASVGVSINGHDVKMPAPGAAAHPAGKQPAGAPGAYVQVNLTDYSILRQGGNQITVMLKNVPRGQKIELTEVRMGIFAGQNYLDTLLE